MNLFDLLASLEEDYEVHTARLLILLKAFAGKKGDKTINGLTKLVKLDFLLRYPVCLERALNAVGASTDTAKVLYHERKNVESSMIRYRYGPWDPRYRRFINLLVGKGLAKVSSRKRTIKVGMTATGLEKASILCKDKNFEDLSSRARILKNYFDIGGTRLKDFIYETFPEIVSLQLGEEIKI
jgi:hypothetical protein